MEEIKWTHRAQTVLCLARESSALLGHGYVGSEHLLLGLAWEGSGLAARLLEGAGLTADGLQAAVTALLGRGDPGAGPVQGMTPRCRHAITMALEEMGRMEQHSLGTEHLLLGLLRERQGAAAQVLRAQVLPAAAVHPARQHGMPGFRRKQAIPAGVLLALPRCAPFRLFFLFLSAYLQRGALLAASLPDRYASV